MLPGFRDAEERWSHIVGFIPEEGVLCDIGSNSGFFAVKAASSRPRLAVLSIEGATGPSVDQRSVLCDWGLPNVVQLQGTMDAVTADTWASTCDAFDVVLLLAVLHWCDDPTRVLGALSSMAKTVILELPDAADEGAGGLTDWRDLWGDDPAAWVAAVTGRPVRLVARVGRHTSEAQGHLLVVQGDVERQSESPYWSSRYDHPHGNHYTVGWQSGQRTLAIRGVSVHAIAGLNIVNLMHLGRLLYPPSKVLVRYAREALRQAPAHLDPSPHNMLWCGNKMHLIDGEDRRGPLSPDESLRTMRNNVRRWARRTARGGYRQPAWNTLTGARERVFAVIRDRLPSGLIKLLRSWQSRVRARNNFYGRD